MLLAGVDLMASLCLSELLDGILDVVVFEAMHRLLTIQLFLVGDLEIQQTIDDLGFFPNMVGRSIIKKLPTYAVVKSKLSSQDL